MAARRSGSDDHDSPWKEVLETCFETFMAWSGPARGARGSILDRGPCLEQGEAHALRHQPRAHDPQEGTRGGDQEGTRGGDPGRDPREPRGPLRREGTRADGRARGHPG